MNGRGADTVVPSVEVKLPSSLSSIYFAWERSESVGMFLGLLGAMAIVSATFSVWELDLLEELEMPRNSSPKLRILADM